MGVFLRGNSCRFFNRSTNFLNGKGDIITETIRRIGYTNTIKENRRAFL